MNSTSTRPATTPAYYLGHSAAAWQTALVRRSRRPRVGPSALDID